MKFWERTGIVVMSCWGLYALHEGTSALMKEHNWVPLSASDWGTWAGAIGTVATLIWAIKLAQMETRLRENQERDAAVIAAAFMDFGFVSYIGRLRDVIKGLEQPVEDNFENPWKNYASKLEKCPVWTRDELQALLYLGNNVAANLAMAQEAVSLCKRTLLATAAQKEAETIDLHELSEINIEVRETLKISLRRVITASSHCSSLLQEQRVT